MSDALSEDQKLPDVGIDGFSIRHLRPEMRRAYATPCVRPFHPETQRSSHLWLRHDGVIECTSCGTSYADHTWNQ